MSTAERLKILYVHGWESGPNGIKSQALQKKFDVYGKEQSVGAFNIFKKNSVISNIIKQQFLYIAGLIGSVFGTYYYLNNKKQDINKNKNKIYLYTSLISLFWFGTIWIKRDYIISKALKASINSSIIIQRNAILKHKPDILIGSSFGGAVIMYLLRKKIWNGPTILLAPGYTKVIRYIRYDIKNVSNSLNLMNINNYSNNKKILIIHGDKDSQIKLEDSVKLQSLNKEKMDLKVIHKW